MRIPQPGDLCDLDAAAVVQGRLGEVPDQQIGLGTFEGARGDQGVRESVGERVGWGREHGGPRLGGEGGVVGAEARERLGDLG